MSFKDIVNSTVRFFVFQSHDMATMPELQAGYTTSILIDKLGMDPNNITIQSVYPFQKYFQEELFPNINIYPEENYFFFLENYYHSSTYANKEIEFILQNTPYKKFYLQSAKMSEFDSIELMNKFSNIVMVIRTDPEYVAYKELAIDSLLSDISNITYRLGGNVISTRHEEVTYKLDDYIFPAYTNGKLFRDKDTALQISKFLDDDNSKTDPKLIHHRPRAMQAEILRLQENNKTVMLTSGRGCKYKCSYCFRGVKYSSVRQISLNTIKTDLDYLQTEGVRQIYFYDDCFITTNKDRLEQIVDLLSGYSFEYYIAIRYEACNPEILEILSKLNFYQVQIGLQSITHNSSHKRSFNHDKLVAAISSINAKRNCVSIDLILGLPGEGKKDFLNSLDYAISMIPKQIIVNTLFLNPGTELSTNYKTFGIKVNSNVGLNVPYIVESDTFSKDDLEECRQILRQKVDLHPSINFIIR